MKLLLLVPLLLLAACGSPAKPGRGGSTLSMNAGKWNIRYSIKMPSHPTQSGSGWYFEWKQDVSEIDYLTCNHTKPITAGSLVMSGTITAADGVWFDHVTEPGNIEGGNPSACRFMIQKDLTTEYGRWFACADCVVLQDGTFYLSVPFDPARWSSVYGKTGNYNSAALAGFKKALASPQALGIVFGGGNFYGHGIRVRNGTARFTMTSFALKP